MSEAAPAPEAVDTIVSGTIVTMDGARRVIADGAVAIRDGAIVAVGPAAEIDAAYARRDAPRRGGCDRPPRLPRLPHPFDAGAAPRAHRRRTADDLPALPSRRHGAVAGGGPCRGEALRRPARPLRRHHGLRLPDQRLRRARGRGARGDARRRRPLPFPSQPQRPGHAPRRALFPDRRPLLAPRSATARRSGTLPAPPT